MKKGIRIYAWTVNSPLEKLQLVQNVQVGYLTDTLDGCEQTTAAPAIQQQQQLLNQLRQTQHQPQQPAVEDLITTTTDHF